MQKRIVYATTQNRQDAEMIGRALVEERLAACVNIIDGTTSIYRWEGKIETSQEALLIAKTTKPLEERVISRINELHVYDCPCIVTLPIENGYQDFLDWIKESVRKP